MTQHIVLGSSIRQAQTRGSPYASLVDDLSDAAVALLSDLVAIDSVNPGLVDGAAGEPAIVAFLANRLRANGFTVTIIDAEGHANRPSLLAVGPGPADAPTVVLNGHLDTVGVSGMPSPFTPRVEGHQLFGRGAADMKGGVAAMVVAAERLAADHLTTNHLTTFRPTHEGPTPAQPTGTRGGIRPVLALVADVAFIRQFGIDASHLEGYLFPETYTLVRHEANEETVIRMMVDRFRQVWKELEIPANIQLNQHQVLTLASVVEKETGVAGERPLIARVFYNRLTKKMRLQSDPTVIYGIRDFNGNLTRADLKRETPYNTYVIPALPPGPICSPGRASLEAVLRPVASDALYFVAKNDGTHVFSSNLADHNRAVQIYQRGL